MNKLTGLPTRDTWLGLGVPTQAWGCGMRSAPAIPQSGVYPRETASQPLVQPPVTVAAFTSEFPSSALLTSGLFKEVINIFRCVKPRALEGRDGRDRGYEGDAPWQHLARMDTIVTHLFWWEWGRGGGG